jgi:hypothetical protein
MKNITTKIILSLIALTFFFRTTFGQTITDFNINVYVLNGPQCSHWYYGVLNDTVLGTTVLNAYDIDTFVQQYVYKFVVQSTTIPSNATFQFCAITTPPCDCVDACVYASPVGVGGAITMLLCDDSATGVTEVRDSVVQPYQQKFFNNDVLTFRFDPCELSNKYYVFNTTGAVVQCGVIDRCDFTLDLRNLPFGLYMIRTQQLPK